MTKINKTIEDRNKTHGDFATCANSAQRIKQIFRNGPGYKDLTIQEKEALDMIATKMARLINGATDRVDTWHDVAGYSTLAERSVKR